MAWRSERNIDHAPPYRGELSVDSKVSTMVVIMSTVDSHHVLADLRALFHAGVKP
jgi:hypothetical protein